MGPAAPGWLGARHLPARLVAPGGRVTTVAGWPAEAVAAAGPAPRPEIERRPVDPWSPPRHQLPGPVVPDPGVRSGRPDPAHAHHGAGPDRGGAVRPVRAGPGSWCPPCTATPPCWRWRPWPCTSSRRSWTATRPSTRRRVPAVRFRLPADLDGVRGPRRRPDGGPGDHQPAPGAAGPPGLAGGPLGAYACWPVAVIHGLGTGSDTKLGWVQVVYVVCVVAVLLSLWWRLARGWTAPTPAERGMAVVASVVLPLALAVWTVTGPLQAGWAESPVPPSRCSASGPRPPAATGRAGARSPATLGRAFHRWLPGHPATDRAGRQRGRDGDHRRGVRGSAKAATSPSSSPASPPPAAVSS